MGEEWIKPRISREYTLWFNIFLFLSLCLLFSFFPFLSLSHVGCYLAFTSFPHPSRPSKKEKVKEERRLHVKYRRPLFYRVAKVISVSIFSLLSWPTFFNWLEQIIIFLFTMEWFSKRFLCWKNNILSRARKEVGLKMVAQVIHVYSMSTFLLVHNSYDNIQKMMNSFLWGSANNDHRK